MPKTHNLQDDAIRGDRIIARAKCISRPNILAGSSKHRIQTTVLTGDVYCVIDLPLVSVRSKSN